MTTNDHSQVKSLLSDRVLLLILFSSTLPCGHQQGEGIPHFWRRGEDRMSVSVARVALACARRDLHSFPESTICSFMLHVFTEPGCVLDPGDITKQVCGQASHLTHLNLSFSTWKMRG